MLKQLWFIVVCLCSSLCAHGGTLYSAIGPYVYTIDPTTGATTFLSSVDADTLVYGDGVLYAADDNGIYAIDPVTGVSSPFSQVGATALAYRDGVLYAAADDRREIYAIDAVSGNTSHFLMPQETTALTAVEDKVATLSGPHLSVYHLAAQNSNYIDVFGSPSKDIVPALAFDETSRLLYAVSWLGELFRVKFDELGIAPIQHVTLLGFAGITNLVAAGDGRTLYVTKDLAGESGVFTVDLFGNEVSSLSPVNATALAYSPISHVPDPATAWLFGSALMGVIGLRRRK